MSSGQFDSPIKSSKSVLHCDQFLQNLSEMFVTSLITQNIENYENNLKICIENSNDLTNLNFSNLTLEDIDFSNKQIMNATFKNTTFKNVDFSNSKLDYSNFQSTKLDNVNFEHSSLKYVDFSDGYFNNIKFTPKTFEKSILLGTFFDCDSPFPDETILPGSSFKLFFDPSLTSNPNITNELSINLIAPSKTYSNLEASVLGITPDFLGLKVASCIVPPMDYLHSGTNQPPPVHTMPSHVVGWMPNSDQNPRFFYTNDEQRVHLLTDALQTKIFAQLTFKENGTIYTDTEQLTIDSIPTNLRWWDNDDGKKLDLFLLPNHDDFPVTVDLLGCNGCPDKILQGKNIVFNQNDLGNPFNVPSWQPDPVIETFLNQPAAVVGYDTFQIFVDDEYEDEGAFDWVVSHFFGWTIDKILNASTLGIYDYTSYVLTGVNFASENLFDGPAIPTSLGDMINNKIAESYDTPFVNGFVFSEKYRHLIPVFLFEVGDGQYASPKIRVYEITDQLTDKIYVIYGHKGRNVSASITVDNVSNSSPEKSPPIINLQVDYDQGIPILIASTTPSTPLLFMYSADNITWKSFEEKTTSKLGGLTSFKWTDYPYNLETVYVKARDTSNDIVYAQSNVVEVDLPHFTITVSANTLGHKWFDGKWSNWENLGGELTSGPTVSSWSEGRLDVFAKGTDNALHHKWFDGKWSNWENLGGELTSDPAAVSWSNKRIDVFANSLESVDQIDKEKSLFGKIKIFGEPLKLNPPSSPSKFIDEINSMSPEKIPGLSKDKLSQFTPEVVNGLKVSVFDKITIDQFGSLPIETTKTLTGGKLGQFKQVLQEITPQIVQRLDSKAIATLPPDSINEMPHTTKSIFKTKAATSIFGSIGQSMDEGIIQSKLFVPPLKQIKLGVLPEHVVCNDGLVLVEMISSKKPICISENVFDVLLERKIISETFN